MDFYTNVVQWGNNLLVRGVQNGQRTNFKVDYSPTLFVPVMKQTGWKTLDNNPDQDYVNEKYLGMIRNIKRKVIQETVTN